MKRANISTTKNNLSKLIDEVRGGDTILITDRDVPVARLEPVTSLGGLSGRVPSLARDGIVSLPVTQLNARHFLSRTKAQLSEGVSGVAALLDERGESR